MRARIVVLRFVSAVAIVAAAATVVSPTSGVRVEASAATPAEVVSDAIALAVAERVGGNARVRVTKLQTRLPSTRRSPNKTEGSAASGVEGVVASPAPGARTGTPARFTLFLRGKRIGTAVATVHVTARHVRARRALGRHEVLTADDVEDIEGPLGDQPIRRLPSLDDVVGARVRRNVISGEPIAALVIELPMAVKSGDVVTAAVRIGGVEAERRGVASGSGQIGDVVRVVTPGSRRPLKARITGPGHVEIIL